MDQDQGAPLRRLEISFNQGANWKALMSKYIMSIPLSGDASCRAELIMSAPPVTAVSSAMIANVGAAARDLYHRLANGPGHTVST